MFSDKRPGLAVRAVQTEGKAFPALVQSPATGVVSGEAPTHATCYRKAEDMKTWTETLTVAALAVLFTLAACGPEDVGNVTPDIDEEAVATVQAELEAMLVGRSYSVKPSFRTTQLMERLERLERLEQRRIDPDLDEESIRQYARDETTRFPSSSRVRLNEAETDLLLERMRAKKVVGK